MERMIMTHHAEARSRQRGITYDAIDVILTFGREAPTWDSCHAVFMDKAGRRQARKELGQAGYARIEARLNVCVILGRDDQVVTCMHRTARLKHAA